MQYREIAISKRALYGIQDGDMMRLFWRDAMRRGGIDPDKPWTQEELPDRYIIRQEAAQKGRDMTIDDLEQAIATGAEFKPSDFEPHRDGKRFHVREFGTEHQVYGRGLVHVCMCTNVRMADMVAAALEDAACRPGG